MVSTVAHGLRDVDGCWRRGEMGGGGERRGKWIASGASAELPKREAPRDRTIYDVQATSGNSFTRPSAGRSLDTVDAFDYESKKTSSRGYTTYNNEC